MLFYLMWVSCLHVCLCNICVPAPDRGQKGVSDPLEVELHVVVDHHVSASIKLPSSEEQPVLLTGKPPIKCGEDSMELAMSGTDAIDGWLQRETNGRDLGEMRVAQLLERNTKEHVVNTCLIWT